MFQKALFILLGSAGLAACAAETAYVPTTNSSATVAGKPAADYPVPPDAPAGDVRLATLGVANVHPVGTPARTVKAIHLRMVATNKDQGAWTVDSREQRLAFTGSVETHAGLAFADQGAVPPVVTILPGETRTIDLFFMLPTIYQNVSKYPDLNVRWTVHTPERSVVQNTPFDRVRNDATGDNWDVYGNWGGPSNAEPRGDRTMEGP